ncbi:hypothetical protein BDV93DRAFT_461097, partial [Ceratobasidium sp. AG-I]
MWTASKYLGNEGTDGGRARVPTLVHTTQDGSPTTASNNQAKSQILLEAFFPPPPPKLPARSQPPRHTPVPDLPELSEEDVRKAILAMKPHKAPGPDGLPACVYREGIEALTPILLPVFKSSIATGLYPAAWRHSRTAVLRKAGKPNYSVAKAYRPIALLNVMSKILSACVADRLNSLAERYHWIPDHHFGG